MTITALLSHWCWKDSKRWRLTHKGSLAISSSENLPQGSCRIHGLLAWLRLQRQEWRERERAAAGSSFIFYDLALEVMQHHFQHVLLVKVVTMIHPPSHFKERDRDPCA